MKVTKTMIGSVACAALLGVQGCAVSNDPYVNGMATGALATAAVSWLFYSANDGYLLLRPQLQPHAESLPPAAQYGNSPY